jgi:hypothetical protein
MWSPPITASPEELPDALVRVAALDGAHVVLQAEGRVGDEVGRPVQAGVEGFCLAGVRGEALVGGERGGREKGVGGEGGFLNL